MIQRVQHYKRINGKIKEEIKEDIKNILLLQNNILHHKKYKQAEHEFKAMKKPTESSSLQDKELYKKISNILKHKKL